MGKKIERPRMEVIREEVDALCVKRNECIEFNEYKKIDKDIDPEIKKLIDEYTDLAEKKCFAEIANAENPMLEAVKQLDYTTIRMVEKKEEGSSKITEIDEIDKPINPLTLHRAVDGGVGIEKKETGGLPQWDHTIQELTAIMTVRRCYDLGIDPKKVVGDIKVSKTAIAKVGALLEDGSLSVDTNAFNELVKTEMQKVVNEMTGVGEVTMQMVAFLNGIFGRKTSRKHLDMTMAAVSHMRLYMMDICNACATGAGFTATYKVKKAK